MRNGKILENRESDKIRWALLAGCETLNWLPCASLLLDERITLNMLPVPGFHLQRQSRTTAAKLPCACVRQAFKVTLQERWKLHDAEPLASILGAPWCLPSMPQLQDSKCPVRQLYPTFVLPTVLRVVHAYSAGCSAFFKELPADWNPSAKLLQAPKSARQTLHSSHMQRDVSLNPCGGFYRSHTSTLPKQNKRSLHL